MNDTLNQNPEQITRDKIDRMLLDAGWVVQPKRRVNLAAGKGVADQEYQPDVGPADYVLFVDRKPVGIIEAKREGEGDKLTVVEEQSKDYAQGKLKYLDNDPLPFVYESTGTITRFTDHRDPKPMGRNVFSFHKPDTFAERLKREKSLRGRLLEMPALKGVKIFFLFFVLYVNAQAQNYDESKVPAYTLPEVLETADGDVINHKSGWEEQRRPEILSLFENNIYGQMPQTYDSIKFKIAGKAANAMNGKAHLKEVDITVWKNNKSANIHLILFIPNNAKKPVPAFLFINNRDEDNTDPTRAIKKEFWPAELVIDSGYAIAAFHVSDAAPDDPDKYQNGVLQLYPEQLQADSGMKAIGAWAWAASRAMDYFEKDKDINASTVAIVGHSRGGKAALWAGAQDQRFSMVISNNSGNTGAALSRRRFGETVKVINDAFPHWFADNYKKYNEKEDSLPVDQHMLISLIAPRPVYVTSASEDLWADPMGSYLSLLHAREVYALYGKHSALSPEPPAVNSPVIHSFLAYHNREGSHDLTAYDWRNFILFANYHF